jgi:hypothetical protein
MTHTTNKNKNKQKQKQKQKSLRGFFHGHKNKTLYDITQEFSEKGEGLGGEKEEKKLKSFFGHKPISFF